MKKQKSKILIVDDLPKNIQLLGTILNEDNYDVEFALNGPDALQWVKNDHFDLILLDIMMPGMDGYEVCTRLKENEKTREIPVIFITAKNDIESTIKGFEVGGIDYITKPFNSQELLSRVKTHIQLYKQKQELNKKNLHITDSINYAQRIQEAALPEDLQIKELLPDHFILYKPRDIVSGDFYWVKQIEHKAIIAVGDCTGHGVPGAFMSMLALSFLNEIIHDVEKINAAHILTELSKKIKYLLKPNSDDQAIKDSIDMSLIIIDYEELSMQFSGAQSLMMMVREGLHDNLSGETDHIKIQQNTEKNNTLFQISGLRRPVGFDYRQHKKDFYNQNFRLKEGDVVYLFSDGYIDQFGGEKNLRYSRKRFKNLLSNIYDKPFNTQKEILEKELITWQNDNSQLDDIVIFGFRVADAYGEVDLF
ncbi:Stalked cell differentiation-controlling protein [Salinivirga cyanobacteriivorans]|uniref:histidine kinase n=1 Tax=Salinivirga cyanobacteriivorans TaxID=1307839 RepID=A0A0S2HWJ5_9BACT|nr:response regulator [Salinivirga cyanobacteriivorans]ALO14325.1 Stalked cell differentiation-controlling protein [Salinivirga cyanobacteriivorans]